jgi:hypothetical protein
VFGNGHLENRKEDLVGLREVDNRMKGELNWSSLVLCGGFEIINVLLLYNNNNNK